MKIDHDFRMSDGLAQAAGAIAPVHGDFDDMDTRAYMMWASLLRDAPTPSLADLDLHDADSFRDQGLLLKVDLGADDAAIVHLGRNLRTELAIWAPCHKLSEAPAHPVLTNFVAECRKAIGQKAPLRHEAPAPEKGADYWAMLLPFSSDGGRLDHVYAVVGWREAKRVAEAPAPVAPTSPAPISFTFCDDTLDLTLDQAIEEPAGGLAAGLVDNLADSLDLARSGAQEAAEAHGRSRLALYRAIGLAHDFALTARQAPADYERLLVDAGIVAQPRSPMTALAKLVFGGGYDKTRLAEIALVLAHALDEGLPTGTLAARLQDCPGGLKGHVRALRKGAGTGAPAVSAPVLGERIRKRLAKVEPLSALRLTPGETVVLVARCSPDGSLEIVAQIEDERIAAPVFRHVVRQIRRG